MLDDNRSWAQSHIVEKIAGRIDCKRVGAWERQAAGRPRLSCAVLSGALQPSYGHMVKQRSAQISVSNCLNKFLQCTDRTNPSSALNAAL